MNSLKPTRLLGLVALMLAMTACTDPMGSESETTQHVGTATVTTDQATYPNSQSITATWSGMPGNPFDWIAVVPAGSPVDSGFIQWSYINSQVSGSFVFNPLPVGSYEVRAYLDNSYTILASATFMVSGAAITTDLALYTVNQAITASWTGMPGNQFDWVTIVPAGSPPNSGFIEWSYVNGQTSGSFTFNPVAAGDYEARVYFDNSYTVLATTAFKVTGATITTDQQSYQTTQTITATWAGMPGNMFDWIAVVPAGSPANSGFLQWTYINGQTSGSFAFTPLAAGSYEVRAFLNNTYTILASSTFVVTSTSISIATDQPTYLPTQNITVNWIGMPGNMFDWVGIVTAGSPPNSGFVAWTYMNGQATGSTTFGPLPVGSYEVRGYLNNTYTILSSATFGVTVTNTCVSAAQRPVLGSLTSGDLVIDATQSENTAPITAPNGTSILFTSMNETEPSPKYGAVLCDLHDVDQPTVGTPAGVTCSRNNLGTDTGSGQISIHWTVVTFTSGVTVQRGHVDTHQANPTAVALTAVNPAETFVLLGGMFNDGTGWGNNEFVRAQLLDGQTLDIRSGVQGTEVAWQVVSMTGATVQRGTASFATADLQQQVAITQAPSGSMVLASYNTDNASGIAAASIMMATSLMDPSTILFQRDLGGAALDVSWEVVSLPYATQSGLATFGTGQVSQAVAVTNISPASSVGITSTQAILGQSTGSTSYAGSDLDLVGEAAVTLTTAVNGLAMTRATSQGTAEVPWTVIDFAHDCTGL